MKYNRKTNKTNKTVNLAGGKAYKESDKLELVSILLTSFVKSQFYREEKGTVDRLEELVAGQKDKKFVAKAAIYARTKFGMRSVSHIVAANIASQVKGVDWTKRFFDKIVYRPDDMLEIMAYYLDKNGKPIPNSVKKGFANAFNKFDEYSLAKYRGEGSAISLVDIVNLCHPKGNDKNKKALEKLIKGTLKSKDTWESEVSKAGQVAETEEQKDELKKGAWTKLIQEKKIGYFALLRNLRNIIQTAPEALEDALEMLVDEKLIKKSLVLPFRFLTAIQEMEKIGDADSRKALKALNKAVDISLNNVPKFDGKNCIVMDGSGSMSGKPGDIGSLFSAILLKANENSDFILFSDNAVYHSLNTDDSTLSIAEKIRSNFESAGTDFNSIFEKMNKGYDRIIILSDMQGWQRGGAPTTFAPYKKKYKCDPIVYSFDLAGYSTLMFPENNVYALVGFSEKTMDIMKLLEGDKKALIHEIEAIEI